MDVVPAAPFPSIHSPSAQVGKSPDTARETFLCMWPQRDAVTLERDLSAEIPLEQLEAPSSQLLRLPLVSAEASTCYLPPRSARNVGRTRFPMLRSLLLQVDHSLLASLLSSLFSLLLSSLSFKLSWSALC